MTMDQINTRIEELRNEKTRIQGMETEIYARIVGYYRSVRNWNKGKKEEYAVRRNYSQLESGRPGSADGFAASPAPASILEVVRDENQQQLSFSDSATTASYLYFFRKTCPNCPPVADWLKESGLEGRGIDVDRESGMNEARRFDITAAPTVVFLNAAGEETGRGCSVTALENQMGLAAVAGA